MYVPNPVAKRNIIKSIWQRAVKFGDLPRSNDIKRWPFWLPFIPQPPQDDTLAPFPLLIANGSLGWPVAPNTFRDIPILTEQDAHYNLVNMKVSAFRGPATGEITVLANATAVVGIGTNFLTEYLPGDTMIAVDDSGQRRFAVVAAIATNLALTLHAPFGPNAITGAGAVGLPPVSRYFRGDQWYQLSDHLTGGIQVAGVNVTGIGTAFNTELQVGQNVAYIDDTGAVNIRTIATIPGAAAMTFTAAGGAVAGVAGVAFKLSCQPGLTFNRFRPLYTYLRASAFIKSSGQRYYLGGTSELLGNAAYAPASLSVGNVGGGLQERPHALRSIQGFQDGLAMLYTPQQVPREGTIFVRVHNTHNAYTLQVDGTLFGYKVAV